MDKSRISKENFEKAVNYAYGKDERFPILLLVDGSAGIYAYDELVRRYEVFVYRDGIDEGSEKGDLYESFEKYLERSNKDYPDLNPRNISTVFSPDNDGFLENIVDFEGSLFVKGTDGVYYEVTSIDGDIFGVNPEADYDDITETYFFSD